MKKTFLKVYVQFLLTLGLAIYLADKWASGKLSYYINARFFPLTLFGMGALTLIAAAGWLRLYRDISAENDSPKKNAPIILALFLSTLPMVITLTVPHLVYILIAFALSGILGWLLLLWRNARSGDHHTAIDLPRASLLILSLPLIIGLAAPEQPLNTSSLATRGVALSAPMSISSKNSDVLAVQEDSRTILDWVKLFNYESDPSMHIGEDVTVIGFVYHDPRLPEGQFMVSRFIITCCVADAFAIGMPVDWPQETQFEDNTWIQVQGSLDEAQIGGQTVPMVHATSIETIPAPEQPYLYP
jgi:putative membrane protein